MYIPNTMPKTPEEMYDFLEPTIEDGIFDSISIVDDSTSLSGKLILCAQSGNTILTIWPDISSGLGTWYFIPHPAEGVNPDSPASTHIRSVNVAATDTETDWCFMRCHGGVGFMYWPYTNSNVTASVFFIAKGSNGKTAFLSHGENINDLKASSYGQTRNAVSLVGTMCPTQFGDNKNLSLWSSGVHTYCNSTSADRTILQQIPIIGERGSTGYFETLFVRTAVQEPTYGRQLLGDHYYGCLSNFAILDDDPE